MRHRPSSSYSASFAPQSPPMQSHAPWSPTSPTSPLAGYTPTAFDAPSGPYGAYVQPEVFYGSLIDMSSGRPSEVLSRMSDALFTFLDQNVEIPQLRGTGYIEPLKYGWLHRRLAIDPVSCRILEENIQTYYNMSSIPYHVVVINGIPTPILDRRGFLHMIVFDIRATPDDSHLDWSKYFPMFGLLDPATNIPFPTPFPRSALPFVADPQLAAVVINWHAFFISKVTEAQTNEAVAKIMGPRYMPGASVYAPSVGVIPGTNPYMAQYEAEVKAQKRKSTMFSVAKVVGGLASTLLGGSGTNIPGVDGFSGY